MIMNGHGGIAPLDGSVKFVTRSFPHERPSLQIPDHGPPVCTGCHHVILDEFVSRVQGRPWHSGCLRCSVCHEHLTSTCYAQGSHLFCKEHFFNRLLGACCAGCGGGIHPTEHVRRAHVNLYHTSCFTCVVCEKNLETGEEFFLRDDGALICSHDNNNKDAGHGSKASNERKSRTTLSASQTEVLSNSFRSCSKPSRQMREHLSTETGLDEKVIQVWFQNKRAKCKRDEHHTSEPSIDLKHHQRLEFNATQTTVPLNGGYEDDRVSHDVLHAVPHENQHAHHADVTWGAEFWDAHFPPSFDLTEDEICSSQGAWGGCDQMMNYRH
ncbi:LIM/homeobox protein Lhx4-like [Haliotis rufescens]|uniref:LIM/homeobox protein Lhx4-like n=1 Tax=Haliotis rufescens TaxID=6454 RepID=UPI00201EBBC8|nr:LIM/homeobox protein Lhx4-like [Haliotis rufescens]